MESRKIKINTARYLASIDGNRKQKVKCVRIIWICKNHVNPFSKKHTKRTLAGKNLNVVGMKYNWTWDSENLSFFLVPETGSPTPFCRCVLHSQLALKQNGSTVAHSRWEAAQGLAVERRRKEGEDEKS